MKIALLANATISLPPQTPDGLQQVVADLADGLVNRGHDVTVFATADSTSSAHVVSAYSDVTYLHAVAGTDVRFTEYLQQVALGEALSYIATHDFDIVHCHTNYWALPFLPLVRRPFIVTLHNPIRTKTKFGVERFAHYPYVSVSNAQRSAAALNYVATVYNGIELRNFPFTDRPGEYLAFLGRITTDKAPHLAIEVARLTGLPLQIAGPIALADKQYFKEKIEPYLTETIRYIGPLNLREKVALLQGAKAVLQTTVIPESFGLTMVEAMACGTPVVGFDCGSVPEVVKHGETGFVVPVGDSVAMAKTICAVGSISRAACRTRVVKQFSLESMVQQYEGIYEMQSADNEV